MSQPQPYAIKILEEGLDESNRPFVRIGIYPPGVDPNGVQTLPGGQQLDDQGRRLYSDATTGAPTTSPTDANGNANTPRLLPNVTTAVPPAIDFAERPLDPIDYLGTAGLAPDQVAQLVAQRVHDRALARANDLAFQHAHLGNLRSAAQQYVGTVIPLAVSA